MAQFEDVITNQQMVDIANAIREVTGTTEEMTVPEMPARIRSAGAIRWEEKELNFAEGDTKELGTYDPLEKRLFLLIPKTNEDEVLLGSIVPTKQLAFDEATGKLSLTFAENVDITIHFILIALYLSGTSTTAGLIVTTLPLREGTGIQIQNGVISLTTPVTQADKDNWNGKLDKVSTPTIYDKVYVKDSDGNQVLKDVEADVVNNAIVRRQANGQIEIPLTPVNESDATAKKYVDDACANKLDKVTGSTTRNQLYAKTPQGAQTMVNYTAAALANHIPIRDANGDLTVPPIPSANSKATSKQYVDEKFAWYSEDIYSDAGIVAVDFPFDRPCFIRFSGTLLTEYEDEDTQQIITLTTQFTDAVYFLSPDEDVTILMKVNGSLVYRQIYWDGVTWCVQEGDKKSGSTAKAYYMPLE